MKLTHRHIDNAILRAIHSFAGADERWRERRHTPMTDTQLAKCVSSEIGLGGGFSTWSPEDPERFGPTRFVNYGGGGFPSDGTRCWVELKDDDHDTLTKVSGIALLDHVRRLCDVPHADGSLQQPLL